MASVGLKENRGKRLKILKGMAGGRRNMSMADYTSLALVIVTIGLLFATLIYAYYTKKMLDVQKLLYKLENNNLKWEKKRFKEENKPVMGAFLSIGSNAEVYVKFQNVGKGVANSISAKIFIDDKKESSWSWPSLAHNDFQHISLPKKYYSFRDLKKISVIEIFFTYEDSNFKEYKTSIALDIDALTKDMEVAPTLIPKDEKYYLNGINENVRKVGDHFQNKDMDKKLGINKK